MKEKYSCFNCPAIDYTLRDLDDICPTCNDTYGFPLDSYPEKIGNIDIIQPMARGFYGATYVGEIAPFGGLSIKKAIK